MGYLCLIIGYNTPLVIKIPAFLSQNFFLLKKLIILSLFSLNLYNFIDYKFLFLLTKNN